MESSGKPAAETTGYLEESPGRKSSTRVMSIVALVFLLGFDVAFIFFTEKGVIDWYFVGFNGLFLVAAFVPKYLAKIIEIRK